MATFDAGSIEARLTLDRSAFQRELAAARREGEQFDGTTWTANAQVNADADAIQRLRAQLSALGDETVNVQVDVDSGSLATLRAQLSSLGDEVVNVRVDVDSASLAAARQQLNSLNGNATIWARVVMENSADIGDSSATVRVDVQVEDASLAALRARIEAMRPTVNVDLDVDNDEIDRLRAELSSLDTVINVRLNMPNRVTLASLKRQLDNLNPYEIRVDLDISGALAQLTVLEFAILFAQQVARNPIDVNINTNAAMARLSILDQMLQRITGRHNVTVTANTSAFNALIGSGSRWMLIMQAIAAFSPLLTASIAGIGASAGALVAILLGAGGAVSVLAAAVTGAIQRFKDIEDPLNSADASVRALAQALERLSGAWDRFIDSTQSDTFNLLAQGADLLADVIGRLEPLFAQLVPVIQGAINQVREFLRTPDGDDIFTFIGQVGIPVFRDILAIGGNLLLFFGNLAGAFGAFSLTFSQGLVDLTAKWAAWAGGLGQTQGFQDFLSYVETTGPLILDLLGSIFDAFINIGVALAPLSGPMISGLTSLFDTIADMDPELLGAIAVGIGAIAISTRAWAAAQWLVNAALLANPIGVITLAIIGLIAMIVFLWNTSEEWRERTIADYGWIAEAARGLWDTLTTVFTSITNFLTTVFVDPFESIRNLWDGLRTAVTTTAGLIASTTMTHLNVLIAGVTGIFRLAVEGARRNWDTMVGMVTGIANGVVSAINSIIGTLSGIVSRLFSNTVNAARGAWQGATGMATGIAQEVISGVSGVLSGLGGQVAGYFRSGVELARGAWAQLSGAITGGTNAAMGVVASIPGRITGALGSLGGLLVGAGQSVMSGLARGIESGIGRIRALLNSVTNMIPNWKGPKQRDLQLLVPTGGYIMQGLVKGVQDSVPAVEDALGSVTRRIGNLALNPTMVVASPAPAARTTPQAAPNIDLAELVDSISTQTEVLVQAFRQANAEQLLLRRKGAI